MAGLAAPVPARAREARGKTYRVKAVWKTLQGEGVFAGRPAVFVRFTGCNMWSGEEGDRQRDAARTGAGCPLWCDTDFTKQGSRSYSAEGLVSTMLEVGGGIRFCVLTGGEPLLQADAVLIQALHRAGFFVAVETNGTVSLEESFRDRSSGDLMPPDWIVCSPKLPEDQLHLEFFDELKLVVPDYLPEAYASFAERIRLHEVGGRPLPLLWLQPEDGPRFTEAVQLAIDTALAHPSWRISVQTHKVLDVD
jgi:7-carboxy-7-deazaguanine synthase